MNKLNIVYITNASLKQISRNIMRKIYYPAKSEIISNITDGLDGLISHEDIEDIFNNNEIQELYTLKFLLKDFDLLLKDIGENKQNIYENITSHNKNYAFKVKTPAYHTNHSCKWMYSDFTNIKLPLEFQSLENQQAIHEWIDEHKTLAFEELNKKFQLYFHTNTNLEEVKYSNSGVKNIENIQIKQHLKLRLKNGFTQLRFFFNHEFTNKILNYRYAPKGKINANSLNDKEYRNAVLDFHTIKGEVYDLIIEHFQAEYNKRLAFDISFLEALGFRKCKACKQENYMAMSA